MISPNYALFPLLLAIGLLAPGWLLGRCLGTTRDPVAAFLGSAALLFNLILLLDGLNVALTAPHVAGGLALICAVLAVSTKFRKGVAAPTDGGIRPLWHWRSYHWLLLPAGLGLAAIAIRALLDPLSGFDTFFRWDFLARQMLNEGNLHFYPAITGQDFQHYDWCDGIAPLVSSLYFWTYLSLGKAVEWATAPVVIGQALLLFLTIYHLAAYRGGRAAGCASVTLLATSPLLLWAVAMGQETGLTALSLTAMFLFIERHRESPGSRWLIWAGIAAGTGALAREYGLVFIALGGLGLATKRISRRERLEFIFAALLIAFPWYLRNWLKTGNPLYSHGLGGLFPSNPVQDEYAQTVKNLMGLGTAAARPALLLTLVCTLAGFPLILGLADILNSHRQRPSWLVASAVVVGLWLWSINETSGGAEYSLRVLAPAIALCGAAGGPLLSRWLQSKRRWLSAVLLPLLVVDAAVRSLYMPLFWGIAWHNSPPFAWLRYLELANEWNRHPAWAAITDAAQARSVLVVDPYSYVNIMRRNGNPISIFSPDMRFLFEPEATLQPGLEKLRAKGIRFILISDNRIMKPQLSTHSFFKDLFATRPLMNTPMFTLYDLYSDSRGKVGHVVGTAETRHTP